MLLQIQKGWPMPVVLLKSLPLSLSLNQLPYMLKGVRILRLQWNMSGFHQHSATSFGHLANQFPAKAIWIPKDTGKESSEEVVVLKAPGENIALHLEQAQHMSGVLAGEESSDSIGASPIEQGFVSEGQLKHVSAQNAQAGLSGLVEVQLEKIAHI